MPDNKITQKKAVSSRNGNAITAGPGRPKGSKNKFTTLKEAYMKTFDDLGGADGLYLWANKTDRNRGLFYQWITKMLPSNVEVSGEDGDPIKGELVVRIVKTGDTGSGDGVESK